MTDDPMRDIMDEVNARLRPDYIPTRVNEETPAEPAPEDYEPARAEDPKNDDKKEDADASA